MSLFLGFDSSTQGLKAVLIDTVNGTLVSGHSVNFGGDLPDYGSPQGVLENPDPLIRHADPLMWLAALDLLLERMKESGVTLGDVSGIGGCGQQHGSVYLKGRFSSILATLDPEDDLARQIAPALSRSTSPIWMDGSTGTECFWLNSKFGTHLQDVTGSPATERFTGPQIRKFAAEEPQAYEETSRIHLVSSFLCSVLTGNDACVDSGDGAGMNLLNLNSLNWDPGITEATAPGLTGKLPRIAAHPRIEGTLAPYFEKYGFRPGTPVATWTGDNPASIIGTGACMIGTAALSLGTSDTFFAAMDSYHVNPEHYGHVFGLPSGGYLSLTCFRNGSLARDRVRTEAGVDWDFFGNTAFSLTHAGNGRCWALPWYEPEITPVVGTSGLRANFDFAGATPQARIRAVVEAQAMNMRFHTRWMGDFTTLRVTGGGSRSDGILQTLADVFNAAVETISTTDSAALGSAMIAAHAVEGIPYDSLTSTFCVTARTIRPRQNAVNLHSADLTAFGKFLLSA